MVTTKDGSGFYTAFVCREGHVLTAAAELSPEFATAFCPDCASPSVSACESCGKPIPGHIRGVLAFGDIKPPVYCRYCAAPMPWTTARLDALRELTAIQEGLSDDERATLNRSWDELTRDTARTQVAVVQVKRLLPKLAGASADAMRKILTQVATAEVLRQMGL